MSVVTVEQIRLLTFCMSSGISELLMTGALLSDILFHSETDSTNDLVEMAPFNVGFTVNNAKMRI